jgi:hypothetical protein
MTHPRIERSFCQTLASLNTKCGCAPAPQVFRCAESGGNIRDVKVTTNRRADSQKAELVELIMMTCPRIERGVCLK